MTKERAFYLDDGSETAAALRDVCHNWMFSFHAPEVPENARETVKLGIGKRFKDALIKDVDTSYLEWLRDNFEPHGSERMPFVAAMIELRRREQQPGEQH